MGRFNEAREEIHRAIAMTKNLRERRPIGIDAEQSTFISLILFSPAKEDS